MVPAAEPDDFWDIDEALKHELINRSLRNMLGDCSGMNSASPAPPTSPEQRLIGKGSPFELEQGEFRNAPKSLVDLYAKCRPSDSQLLISHGGTRLTCRQVFQLAGSLAQRLVQKFGIGPGRNVAIVLPNGPEWLISFVAISSAGASVVVVHYGSGEALIAQMISRARCSLVITDERMAGVLPRSLADPPLFLYAKATTDSVANVPPHCTAVDAESIALIASTSGSTGEPKQIFVSHRALMQGVMNTMLASALAAMKNRHGRAQSSGPPVSLLVAPLSHVSGYSHFLTMLRVGGTVVTTPSIDPGDIANLIAENAVSSLVGAQPALVRDLIREPGFRLKLGSLRSLGVQGTSLSADLLAEIMAALPQVTVASGYGLTETNGLIALATGGELLARPRSCGRVIPSVEIQVVDTHGRRASDAAVGEIWIRGPMLANGCANAGWFRTGDAGALDSEAFLTVIGREDQHAAERGDRSSLASLESLALTAGSIDEATAVELPCAQGQARAVVAVIRKAGCALDLEGLRQLLRLHTGAPVHVVELSTLPRTPTGKVNRAALRGALGSLPVTC